MKKMLFALLVILSVLLSSCAPVQTQSDVENAQQASGVKSITENQPIPDLGGFSFERKMVIDTYNFRNNPTPTYAYQITMSGMIIEICASLGNPIPYSTQLTNPLIPTRIYQPGSANTSPIYLEGTVANPEITGLYPPATANATWVQCLNPDGSGNVTPVYWEENVESLPYRIKSDIQLQPIGKSSFSIDPNKK